MKCTRPRFFRFFQDPKVKNGGAFSQKPYFRGFALDPSTPRAIDRGRRSREYLHSLKTLRVRRFSFPTHDPSRPLKHRQFVYFFASDMPPSNLGLFLFLLVGWSWCFRLVGGVYAGTISPAQTTDRKLATAFAVSLRTLGLLAM